MLVAGIAVTISAPKTFADEPIHAAIRTGDLETVRLLCEHDPGSVNALDEYKKTPLHRAAEDNNYPVMRLLLSHGADANTEFADKGTLLHWAARQGDEEMVNLLLVNKADVDAKDVYKRTPLHRAAEQGSCSVMKLLLSNGADPNAEYSDKGTLLHWAARETNAEMVTLLLDNQATVDAKDVYSKTPLHRAAERGSNSVAELLLSHGADPDAEYSDKGTLLHWAVRQGNEELVKVLLKYKANVNVRNVYGKAPLYYAAEQGNCELTELLLGGGTPTAAADPAVKTAPEQPRSSQSATTRKDASSPGREDHPRVSESAQRIASRTRRSSWRSSGYGYPGPSASITDLENFIRYNPDDPRAPEAFQAIVAATTAPPRTKINADYADLTDIWGATYNEETGQLVLWGPRISESKEGYMPPFLLVDDFERALEVLDAGDDPGVSIGTYGRRVPSQQEMEDGIRNRRLPVEYIPESTASTHMGSLLYEADRWLKALGLGLDNATNRPVFCPIPQYRPLTQRTTLNSVGTAGTPSHYGLIWLVSDPPRVACEGYSMKFVGYKMRVEQKAITGDPAIEQFAKQMTDDFDQYKAQYPVFRELVRLHKLVQVARWYKSCGFPYEELLENYQPLRIETPATTTMVQSRIGNTNGYLLGGVDLSPPNCYVPGASVPAQYLQPAALPSWSEGPAHSVAPTRYGSFQGPAPVPTFAAPLLQARPSPTTYTWTVKMDDQVIKVVSITVAKGTAKGVR